MSQLSEDLERDWDEVKSSMDKGDILQGLLVLGTITGEIAAALSLIIPLVKALTFLTGGVAALGVPFLVTPLQALLANQAKAIQKKYENLSREKRNALVSALVFLGISPRIFN